MGLDGWMGYPIPLWHQEHRSRAMLINWGGFFANIVFDSSMVIWFNIGEMLRVQKSTQRNIEGPKVYLKSSGWDHIQARWGQSFGTVHVDDLFCMSIDFPRPQRPRSEGQRTWKVSSLCQWYIIVHVSIVHCLNVHCLIVPFSIFHSSVCPLSNIVQLPNCL